MEIIVNEKRLLINVSMRKIVELTKKNKGNNFKDLFFQKMNDVDFEFLANLIQSCYVKEDSSYDFGGDINKVYDFMQEYASIEDNDFEKLYKEFAEEMNVKSFFGKKMSAKELTMELENPLNGIDINQMVRDSAQSVMKEAVVEEFKGYKG
jgi:hypothetical protein